MARPIPPEAPVMRTAGRSDGFVNRSFADVSVREVVPYQRELCGEKRAKTSSYQNAAPIGLLLSGLL